jgi:hypothetical protein
MREKEVKEIMREVNGYSRGNRAQWKGDEGMKE